MGRTEGESWGGGGEAALRGGPGAFEPAPEVGHRRRRAARLSTARLGAATGKAPVLGG